MEDVKIMVKDCLGPLPRVCQEQVLLDMERSRMMAEDSRCRLNEAIEAFRNSENQRTACEGILIYAMRKLSQQLGPAQWTLSRRMQLYQLLLDAASIAELGSENH